MSKVAKLEGILTVLLQTLPNGNKPAIILKAVGSRVTSNPKTELKIIDIG